MNMHESITAAMIIASPVGHLALVEAQGYLIQCGFTTQAPNENDASPFLRNVAEQLAQYFCQQRTEFIIPLAPVGTAFQQAVWLALGFIAYGETQSYQQIAVAVGRTLACRAVGSANGCNPIAIIIPCHRVIRASGEIGGYAGGIAIKRELLALEQG
jgi:methylated-DNA-[protein]-cysteine S-methyltransferase